MPHAAARMANPDRDAGRYQRHRPEQMLLYQIVGEYYPAFADLVAEQGIAELCARGFEEFLKCGPRGRHRPLGGNVARLRRRSVRAAGERHGHRYTRRIWVIGFSRP